MNHVGVSNIGMSSLEVIDRWVRSVKAQVPSLSFELNGMLEMVDWHLEHGLVCNATTRNQSLQVNVTAYAMKRTHFVIICCTLTFSRIGLTSQASITRPRVKKIMFYATFIIKTAVLYSSMVVGQLLYFLQPAT